MASERILCTGTIVASGEIDWHICPLTGEIEVSDGDIQRLLALSGPEAIDEAAELAEYEEWIADQDYHRSGNW